MSRRLKPLGGLPLLGLPVGCVAGGDGEFQLTEDYTVKWNKVKDLESGAFGDVMVVKDVRVGNYVVPPGEWVVKQVSETRYTGTPRPDLLKKLDGLLNAKNILKKVKRHQVDGGLADGVDTTAIDEEMKKLSDDVRNVKAAKEAFLADSKAEATLAIKMAELGVGIQTFPGNPAFLRRKVDGSLVFYLIMKKADGDLAEYINTTERSKLNAVLVDVEAKIGPMIDEMVDSCTVCVDLKAENILYTTNADGSIDVRLSDFGGDFCHQWYDEERTSTSSSIRSVMADMTPDEKVMAKDVFKDLMKATLSFTMSSKLRRDPGYSLFKGACLRVMHGLLAVAEEELSKRTKTTPQEKVFVRLANGNERQVHAWDPTLGNTKRTHLLQGLYVYSAQKGGVELIDKLDRLFNYHNQWNRISRTDQARDFKLVVYFFDVVAEGVESGVNAYSELDKVLKRIMHVYAK